MLDLFQLNTPLKKWEQYVIFLAAADGWCPFVPLGLQAECHKTVKLSKQDMEGNLS